MAAYAAIIFVKHTDNINTFPMILYRDMLKLGLDTQFEQVTNPAIASTIAPF